MTIKTLTGYTVKASDTGTVKAVIATLNVIDKDGDVILPGAFQGKQDVLISAYGHGSWSGNPPVGKGSVSESDNEAIFDGRFWTDTTAGRETWTVVKEAGDLQEWSFSLEDVVSEPGEFEGRKVKFIRQVKVKEVSPVLRGAGVNTRTLAVKDTTMADLRRIRDRVLAAEERRRFEDIKVRNELRAIRKNVAMAELGYSTREAHFAPVSDREVSRAVRDAAEATLTFCVGHLKLKARPALRWFAPETDRQARYRKRYTAADFDGFEAGDNTAGMAERDANTIWVRAGMSVRQTMSTVAHEARHMAQTSGGGTSGYVANEYDARDYADGFIRSISDN